MNEVIAQNNSVAVANNQQMFLQTLIVNKKPEDLAEFVKNQVFLACVFRGISKTEEERSIIAMMVLSEIQRRFAYLCTTDIERCFKDNKFGSEFSNTVCPEALITCLEKSGHLTTQRENKTKLEMLNAPKQEQRKKSKEEVREEAKRMLVKDYLYYLEDGAVYNFKNWNYLYITRVLNFHHTLTEVKRLLQRAETKAYEKVQERNPLYYRSIKAVMRDYNFIHSKTFKDKKRTEFYYLYVGLFFQKVKNGKYQNPIFSHSNAVLKSNQ
ncbi:MAG: hypothetical protein J6P44_02195 [Bacteroidales bacterium]|nr:hypothetical protein [Bacteroidales bacterium]